MLHGLLAWIRALPAYATLREEVRAGHTPLSSGLRPSARPPVMAALAHELRRPLVIVTPTAKAARHLAEALRLWMPPALELLHFPEPPALFYERAPWTPEIIADRLAVLTALALHRVGAGPPPLIVTSVRALMQRTLPYRQFRRALRRLAVGTRLSLPALARHLTEIGYEPTGLVTAPGQFARRGGLLDLYPLHTEAPYRLDFFGDEVETLRTFAPETQRTLAPASEVWVGPVRELLPRDAPRAQETLRAVLRGSLPPEVRGPLEEDAKALASGVPFPALESYLPLVYGERATLLNYLPAESLVVLDDAAQVAERWQALEEEAETLRRRAEAEGVPTAGRPYVTWAEVQGMLARYPTLSFAAEGEDALAASFTAEPHFAGRIPEAMGRIRLWVSLGDQVVVASRQAARLAALWQEFDPPPVLDALPTPPKGLMTFVRAAAPGGWQWNGPHGPRHLLTDEELFGWRPPEPRRRRRRRVVAPTPALTLKPGDYVVHEDYGIGLFRGLVTRSVDEVEQEYLLVEYGGQDRLYVPVHQADRLTRYVGVEGTAPTLDRLGGTVWAERKARARRAVDQIAQELLALYAARHLAQGHAFAPDTPWQQELEAAFPYVETEDQREAIEAVKRDMEQPRPMDRLICGDSGYGKTEVALRAAFKAVMDGKQVAMLVPTTVLAQQHYETFRERLNPFPVEVALLSRFCTAGEQRDILERLAAGRIDIVIGTHRLLQKDVHFHDLGLVIIDEEQRFGVAHKERFKRMRTEVDVLTLTATPIPRTLYLALAGARDISIIETPPQERLPIATYVGPYDPDVVRRAIRRELEQGGQVFYVHNRVLSIQSAAARLHELVPGARLAVAHGRMRERDLAAVMGRFRRGEVDVLLATTIVESGLDFPNANTLIVERADRMGLAQLYQLRGRVGRGSRRGYAYLFHGRRLTEEARARLQALQTSLQGGGFAVALRDLEIRGAGELLGRRQHGHVAAVGFTLYTRMLAQAVARLKAERAGQPLPPTPIGAITLALPLTAELPTDYVADVDLRLRLYRRMAALTSEAAVDALAAELEDRFGPLPEAARTLLFQLRLKVLARDAGVTTIAVKHGQIVVHPRWLRQLEPAARQALARHLGDRARVGQRELWLPLTPEREQWRRNLRDVLMRLRAWCREGQPDRMQHATESANSAALRRRE